MANYFYSYTFLKTEARIFLIESFCFHPLPEGFIYAAGCGLISIPLEHDRAFRGIDMPSLLVALLGVLSSAYFLNLNWMKELICCNDRLRGASKMLLLC